MIYLVGLILGKKQVFNKMNLNLIAEGQTYFVYENYSSISVSRLQVDGTLIVEGSLGVF